MFDYPENSGRPAELRHSFVSLLSDNGMSLEEIADLCGHSGTSIFGSDDTHGS